MFSVPLPIHAGAGLISFIDAKDGNTCPCGYRGNENPGRFQDIDLEHPDTRMACYQCNGECFRGDPLELSGVVFHGLSEPVCLLRKLRTAPHYFRWWMSDLRYYLACDLFDGRKPPDMKKLAKFQGA